MDKIIHKGESDEYDKKQGNLAKSELNCVIDI